VSNEELKQELFNATYNEVKDRGIQWTVNQLIRLRAQLEEKEQELNRAWQADSERDNQRRGVGY